MAFVDKNALFVFDDLHLETHSLHIGAKPHRQKYGYPQTSSCIRLRFSRKICSHPQSSTKNICWWGFGLIFMLIFAPHKSRTTISSFLIFILHKQIGWFGESKEKHLQQLAPQLAVRHFHRQKQQQREDPWKWCTSCYTFFLAEIFVLSKDRFKF